MSGADVDQQPPVDTLGLPIPADVDDHPPGIVYVVNGPLLFGEGAQKAHLTCAACSASAGPWLLSTWGEGAAATCLCGQHAAHPKLTIAVVVQHCPPPVEGPGLPMFTGTLDQLADLRGFNGTGNDRLTGELWRPLDR